MTKHEQQKQSPFTFSTVQSKSNPISLKLRIKIFVHNCTVFIFDLLIKGHVHITLPFL